MIWILILVLNHPILVNPKLDTMLIYPMPFGSKKSCENIARDEIKKKSIIIGYCQEINPVVNK